MWDWAIWGALSLGGAAGVAAISLVAARARQLWRAVKGTRRDVVQRLDELAAAGETTADKLATAGDMAELHESLRHLRVSLARLAVLRQAIDEAEGVIGRVTSVIPRA
jgi:hypothetical protein